jgi:DNA repair protein RadC
MSNIVRDLLGNYHLGHTLTDSDILSAAEAILEQQWIHRGDTMGEPGSTARFLKLRLAGYPHEVFAALFLDNRHRVIAYEELFRGSIDACSVHPREVLRRCLHHNAAAIVFAHNHPSGIAEPSEADRTITARLKEALALVDVRVLDHFVVGSGEPTSMALRGLL